METTEVVQTFYESFTAKNGVKMASFYATDVHFQDPVFPNLRGDEAKFMWQMLCARGRDLKIDFKIISGDGRNFQVKWDAHYTFVGTGRSVHNRVMANLTVENGKIIKHRDDFSFWRWASQALGPVGFLFGWTPFIKKKVQTQARKSLEQFMINSSTKK